MAERPVSMAGPDRDGVIVLTWETLSNTDQTGAAVRVPSHADKCVTATGTFGGTISLQGSNEDPPVNWHILSDQAASAISLSAAGIAQVAENPLFIRPAQTAGTVSDVDVIVVCSPRNQ